MTFPRSLYPRDWKRIARGIRLRARDQCECVGECGRDHDGRCGAMQGDRSENGRGKVRLAAAHLHRGPCRCALRNHGRKCGIDSHLKAFCPGCHIRYDGTKIGGRRRG